MPDVTVLKAARHGSRNGVSPAWLGATKPEVVVISCGLDNPYGHPHPWALRYYETVAEHVYRTDLHGEVGVLGRRDGEYTVVTEKKGAAAAADPAVRAPAAAPVAEGIGLRVFADAPGNDHYNRNGEYVVVSNSGSAALEVGAWSFCDAAGACFTFPSRASIEGGGKVMVFTGAGRSDGINFYMNRGRAVWNNNGDVATLRDATGRVAARYAY